MNDVERAQVKRAVALNAEVGFSLVCWPRTAWEWTQEQRELFGELEQARLDKTP